MYQTIIIGGGPSGLMAAVAASEQSQNVLVFFKKEPDTFSMFRFKNILDKIKISLYLLMHYYFSLSLLQ